MSSVDDDYDAPMPDREVNQGAEIKDDIGVDEEDDEQGGVSSRKKL